MGLDVELIWLGPESVGRTATQAAVGDSRSRFASAVERAQRTESSPMLERIDLCGVLELSSDEMPQLLTELDQLLGESVDDPERTVLTAVRRLAERCAADRELALRLVGD